MDQILKVLARLGESITTLRAQNRQMFNLMLAAAALAALLGGGFYLFNPGAPMVLAANLGAADRTALALRLRRRAIPFTLTGTSVLVPSRDLSAAQGVLARSPGFAGGGDDFSIFDRSTMGESDFDEQVNYQRSLQGELERTIMDIRGIGSARVMLAMGRPAPFALQQADAERASVMLTTAPGATIDGTMASAIAHLVAGSVRGLSTERVVVTTDDGTILYPPQHEGELGEAIRLRNDFEHRLQEKVSALLGRIMGANRYAVAVSVDVDTSRVTSKDEIYGSGGQTILSEEHTVTPGGAQVGGIPGLTSNLPVATPSAAPTAAAVPADKNAPAKTAAVREHATAQASTKDIVNYKPSSREINSTTAPVRIKRISVAAVLDGTYENGHFAPLPKARLQAIEGLVATAVGADRARGDSVDIQCAALSQPYVPPLPNPVQQLRSLASNPLYLYGGIGAALLLLAMIGWMIKRAIARLFGARRQVRIAPALAAESAPAQAAADGQAQAPQPETSAAPQPGAGAQPSEYEQLRVQINQEAERDPEAAAAVLRKWLNGTGETESHPSDA
jgi:flagellar M-ring protein FliF